MQNTGKIIGFSKYTKDQLEKMRSALQISLSLDQLDACAAYYRDTAKRDPFIAELRLLGRLANHPSVPMLTVAPTELITDNKAIADTYADLMSKRRTLFPSKRTPCTLGEVLPILNEAFRSVGKEPAKSNTVMLWQEAERYVLPKEPARGVYAPNGRIRLTEQAVAVTDTVPEERDFWAILLPVAMRTPADRRGAELLLSEDCAAHIEQVVSVGSAGLMEALLQVADGLWIELSRLSQVDEDVPLSIMTDCYEGRHLIRVSGKHVNSVMQAARAIGLRMMPFAMVSNEPRYVFANEKKAVFSLDSAFLRSLSRLHTASMALTEQTDVPPSPIAHTPLSTAVCSYLDRSDKIVSEDVIQIEKTLHATATSASSGTCGFEAAMRTVLAPLLTLAANGCDLGMSRLSVALELPQGTPDKAMAEQALSQILGIYRVLAELGRPISAWKTIASKEICTPELTVFASADGESTVPSRFVGDGHRVYCIAPDLRADGTYDIKSLRSLLSYLCDLKKKGDLLSARILCGESVTEALFAMCTSHTEYRITRDAIAAEGPLPLAILIEAASPIAAQKVAVTVKREPTEENFSLPAPVQSLIWSEKPQITLLASGNDPHAALLRAYLEEKGADARLFSDSTEEMNALSHSLLGSCYLILCGEVVYRPNERLHFALDTLIRSGGRILSVGKPAFLGQYPVSAYPAGLPAALVEQICTSFDEL